MKKISSENLNFLLIGILGTLIIGILVVAIVFKPFPFQNTTSLKNDESSSIKTPVSTNDSGLLDNETDGNSSNEENVVQPTNPTPNSTTPVPTVPNNSPQNTTKDFDVVDYLEEKTQEIANYEDNKTFREKAKETFVTVIDFIFYDQPINGYTFSELSNEAKLKVISIALKLDNLIDQKFPGYKEAIKGKYSDLKGELSVLYVEITQGLCEAVGNDTCNQAKEDFESMKESFGLTWSFLKELGKSGKEKLSDFYLEWRES